MAKYRKGIFLVVYCVNKEKIYYLILKRKLHWKGWEFPKGGINPGEKIGKAARRELREETGFKSLMIKKFNIKGKYHYEKLLKDRPGMIGQNYVLYAAEVKGGKIKIDRIEHSGYKWLEFKDAVKKLAWSNQKKCLRIVNLWLNKKIIAS
jgi:8-oxo-dGTP pyrophosphatase MutT (NUDIX family)